MQMQYYHSRGNLMDNYSDLTVPLYVSGVGYCRQCNMRQPYISCKPYWRLQLMDVVPEGHEEPGLLQPRQFTIFRAEEPYFYNTGTGVATGYYWIHFTGNDVERTVEEAGLEPMKIYTLQEAQMPLLRRDFENLFREIILRRPGWCNMLSSYLVAVLTHLGRYRLNNPYMTPGNSRMRLEKPVMYMNHHYQDNTTVTQLAQMVNLSDRRFRELFQEVYSISPSDYLINLRIQHACELLLDSTMSITEVAEACGYTDPLYFSRLFRKKMGMSPLAYRKGERTEQV